MTLFLDTSHQTFTLGLIKDEEVIFEYKKDFNQKLSTHLMPVIKESLDKIGAKAKDIKQIIVTTGPGSFTGLRSGITVAKTWAFAKDLDIIPISSLKALAASSNADYIVPIIDAKRGFVFAAIYDNNLKPMLKDRYISLDNLKEEINKLDKSYQIVTADDLGLDSISTNIRLEKLIKFINEKPVNPHLVNPEYLKKTEAEEKKELSE